jgi:hypothetical protein
MTRKEDRFTALDAAKGVDRNIDTPSEGRYAASGMQGRLEPAEGITEPVGNHVRINN